ncbi:nitroreductase/quinone reductase family protein [Streptomyces sp. HSW2009]|uniref:nitroreductase/quinone reductase family protein n=1 Tax=Streptomyces sp. HSW2009 TaxID=3142890 RepID=UPI0032ED16F4
MTHYSKPNWFEARVLSGSIAWLARRGVSLFGSAELSVRGRTSGEWRSVPVNPLPLDDTHYLVSARGTTQWVRNMRAAGGGQLRKGRRVQPFTAIELPEGAEKIHVLRTYLTRWGFEVGKFFDGATGTSSDAELAEIAAHHPVFTISFTDGEPCTAHPRQQASTAGTSDSPAHGEQPFAHTAPDDRAATGVARG